MNVASSEEMISHTNGMNRKAYIVVGCKPEHQEVQQDTYLCALLVMTKSVVKLNIKKGSKSFDSED
jgi:hypothetical protein